MRLLVLGLDDEGRSCVVEERQVETVTALPGVAVARLFSTTECPPQAPPAGTGIFDEMPIEPGCMNWMIVDLAPFSEDDEPTLATEMHYNNAIELFCVLEGSMQTILHDGIHDLGVGDCVAMPGVDHATRGGPHGARVLSISIGLANAG